MKADHAEIHDCFVNSLQMDVYIMTIVVDKNYLMALVFFYLFGSLDFHDLRLIYRQDDLHLTRSN